MNYWQREKISRSDTVRYRAGDVSDSAIESRIREFYSAAIAGDKKKVSEWISFPLSVAWGSRTNYPQRKMRMKNKEAFAAKYNQIFTPKFINDIKKEVPHDLEMIRGNIIFGDGIVWFDTEGHVITFNVLE